MKKKSGLLNLFVENLWSHFFVVIGLWTQLHWTLAVPNNFFPNLGVKNGQLIHEGIWVRGWRKIALDWLKSGKVIGLSWS